MKSALFLFVIAFAHCASADYSSYHTALEAAINEQLKQFGVGCDVVRKGYYTTDQAMINQPQISVTCNTINADKTVNVTLSWTAPTTRADGSPLDRSEIKGFNLRHNSTIISLPMVESYTLDAELDSVFALQTVDTNMIVSAWSHEVYL